MKDEAKNLNPKIPFRDRLGQAVKRKWQGALSNLRMSLTLRIALHYALQLARTTIPALLLLTASLVLMTIPRADQAMDELMQLKPQNGVYFTQAQLASLPFEEAWITQNGPEPGFAGMKERIVLAFSDVEKNGEYRLLLYMPLPQGGLVACHSRLSHTVLGTGRCNVPDLCGPFLQRRSIE